MYSKGVIFIGLLESDKNKRTINTIESILGNFSYEIIYKDRFKSVLYLKKRKNILFIINILAQDIGSYKSLGIRFDILIHDFIRKEEVNNNLLNPLFTTCKYLIVNMDDENWTLLPLESFKGLVVNYGYNRKASLTISSYNSNGLLKANLYLQRKLKTIFQEEVSPFEFTIEASCKKRKDIYPILSATALNLILFNKDLPRKFYKRINIEKE